jgi:O-antigen/teichoic acid export membrane protein
VNPDPAATIPSEAATTLNARQSSDWDLRNAPRNYLALILSQGASAVFSFGAVWLITFYLGSEGYGGVVAVIAASQVAQIFVNWTALAVVRFGVDEFIETAKIARTFWIRFIALAINLILVIGLSVFWYPPLAGWLKLPPNTYWLVIAHFFLTAMWVHVQMSLQGAKMLRLQGILLAVERLLILSGIVGLLAAKDLNETTAVVCYAVAPAMMFVAGTIALRRYIFARFSVDRQFLRKLAAYSLPLLPMAIVGYFATVYVDAIFISYFLSTSDLGVYSVATQINGILLQIPTLANTLLLPLFITMWREEQTGRLQKFFDRVLPFLTLTWGMACTLFALFCTIAIPLVFAPEFNAAVVPLWIMLVATAVAFPSMVGYQALGNSMSATYISLWAVVAAAVTKVVFNFILIREMGIAGCAWATVAGFAAAVFVSGLLLRRRILIKLSWTNIAIAPVILGGLVVWLTSSALLGLGVSVLSTALLVFYLRDAIGDTLRFLTYFRKRTV